MPRHGDLFAHTAGTSRMEVASITVAIAQGLLESFETLLSHLGVGMREAAWPNDAGRRHWG